MEVIKKQDLVQKLALLYPIFPGTSAKVVELPGGGIDMKALLGDDIVELPGGGIDVKALLQNRKSPLNVLHTLELAIASKVSEQLTELLRDLPDVLNRQHYRMISKRLKRYHAYRMEQIKKSSTIKGFRSQTLLEEIDERKRILRDLFLVEG